MITSWQIYKYENQILSSYPTPHAHTSECPSSRMHEPLQQPPPRLLCGQQVGDVVGLVLHGVCPEGEAESEPGADEERQRMQLIRL